MSMPATYMNFVFGNALGLCNDMACCCTVNYCLTRSVC